MQRIDTDTDSREVLEDQDLVSQLFGRPMSAAREEQSQLIHNQLPIWLINQQPPSHVACDIAQSHQNTLTLVNEHDLPIEFIGFGKIPENFQVFDGPDCDWVLLNILEDPILSHRNGRLPVPRTVKKNILKMAAIGIDFSATFIAHAVPKGSMKGKREISLEQVFPYPDPSASTRLGRLDRGIMKLNQVTRVAIKAVAVTGATVSAGALAVPALLATALPAGAAAGSLLVLDPILFGVHVFDNWRTEDFRPIGGWYYLTNWFWPVKGVKR